ncbi:MAG: hypothetical protein JWO08_3814 [Verrucomicrobiaceae bacterium]|nr:hypothetical protein [Verrucomicrobiaceae bacterium]
MPGALLKQICNVLSGQRIDRLEEFQAGLLNRAGFEVQRPSLSRCEESARNPRPNLVPSLLQCWKVLKVRCASFDLGRHRQQALCSLATCTRLRKADRISAKPPSLQKIANSCLKFPRKTVNGKRRLPALREGRTHASHRPWPGRNRCVRWAVNARQGRHPSPSGSIREWGLPSGS